MGPNGDKLYAKIWTVERDLPAFRVFMEDFYERCHALHPQLL